jgi:hypothetical protein
MDNEVLLVTTPTKAEEKQGWLIRNRKAQFVGGLVRMFVKLLYLINNCFDT